MSNIDIENLMKTAKELNGKPLNILDTEGDIVLDQASIRKVLEEGKNDPRLNDPKFQKEPTIEDGIPTELIGGGIVIDTTPKVYEKEEIGLSLAGKERIDKRLSQDDEEIAELKALADKKKAEAEALAEEKEKTQGTVEDIAEQLQDKYNETVVIIDKSKMGEVEFTDAERDKMERSTVIRVQEVENLDLSVIKIKKNLTDKTLKRIISAKKAPYSTKIVLPVSGYTAVMSACSTYELLDLKYADEIQMENEIAMKKKWSIIHSKILSTSLGNMSFDQFCQVTSYLDYNTFIYGITAATYGSQVKNIPLECECGSEIDNELMLKSLIRPERMSDRMLKLFEGCVDNETLLDDAKSYREANAPAMVIKNVRLPLSNYIVSFRIQSVYDYIHYTANKLESIKNDRLKFNLATIACNIERILIPDEENAGSFYEIDSLLDEIEVLYNLEDEDNLVVSDQINKLLEGLDMEFGVLNAKCKHCGKITPFVPVPIEDLLFYLVGQANAKEIVE